MIKEDIAELLARKDYDIRVTRNARFFDQKVTPDILCVVADCVFNLVESLSEEDNTFTSKDIWLFDYTATNVQDLFSKPNVNNATVITEYNKFFLQPLRMLAYSGVLSETKIGGKWFFEVTELEILEYIASREKNSLYFIQEYLIKVLSDSNIFEQFESFMLLQNKLSFNALKMNFVSFMQEYTPIEEMDEPRRIFNKILNPICFKNKKLGTSRGYLSKDIISYDQLMYNRKNFRDISKKQSESRAEYEQRAQFEIEYQNRNRTKYSISKAKRLIKSINTHSEDQRIPDTASSLELHHIFMASEYPRIDSYTENLILLTSNQHRAEAHPNANFQYIDPSHQHAYLLIKSHNIEESIGRNEVIYDKESFVEVLSIGLNSQEFHVGLSYVELRDKIEEIYEL